MKTRAQGGYSLIEVLIATGILGSVLLGILTLFFLGRANVYSGKQMTRANAIGTRVLEDFSGMTADDVINNMALNDTLSTNTFDGASYSDTIKLTITKTSTFNTASNGNDPQGFKTAWKNLILDESFNNGQIEVLFIPKLPTDINAKMTTSQLLQVRGAVIWNESQRQRRVNFDTSKVYRR